MSFLALCCQLVQRRTRCVVKGESLFPDRKHPNIQRARRGRNFPVVKELTLGIVERDICCVWERGPRIERGPLSAGVREMTAPNEGHCSKDVSVKHVVRSNLCSQQEI